MLRAANLFAATQTFVDKAMQHGQMVLGAKGDSPDDAASFNPDFWAENGDIELADYSEGADRPEEDVAATSSTDAAPITIIEETVIVVVEPVEPEEPYDNIDSDEEEYNPEDYDVDYGYDYDYEYDGGYDDYYEDYCETCLPNGYEPPKKSDLGVIVGAAFWQVTMPMLVFNAVQQKAYKKRFGDYEPEDFDFDMEEIEWKTKEMEIWDGIQGLNILLWGPMFVLGGFALSGHLEEPAAWWLQNMVSNLYIPVMLNETYQLLEHAYFEGEASNWGQLALWSVSTFAIFATHMGAGSSAISFLRGIDQTAEEDFLPSLFYKWGWMTHDDDETYPY